MLSVPVVNTNGESVGHVDIDPGLLGGRVRPKLIKQAIVAYLAHQRQQSARTKGKSDVEGSTRKLYRQKGTGNARMGQIRTPIRRGGGRAFAKRVPASPVVLPKKMRRLARNNAVLAKIESSDALIVQDLQLTEPKTKPLVQILSRLGADRGCVLATHEYDRNLYLSGRNIDKTDVRVVDELSAYEVLRRRKLVFTRPAFERLTGSSTGADPNRS